MPADRAGREAEGFWTAHPMLPPASVTRRGEFLSAWGEESSIGPDPAAEAAADACGLLAAVLREAGSRPAFASLPPKGDRLGITGVLKFDSTGNRVVEIEAIVARAGEFVRVEAPPTP